MKEKDKPKLVVYGAGSQAEAFERLAKAKEEEYKKEQLDAGRQANAVQRLPIPAPEIMRKAQRNTLIFLIVLSLCLVAEAILLARYHLETREILLRSHNAEVDFAISRNHPWPANKVEPQSFGPGNLPLIALLAAMMVSILRGLFLMAGFEENGNARGRGVVRGTIVAIFVVPLLMIALLFLLILIAWIYYTNIAKK